MSTTSFKAFCVEFYANHVGKTGPEVYAEFEKSGLLKELTTATKTSMAWEWKR